MYANKFKSLDKMHYFLRKYKIPSLSNDAVENLNSQIK